MAKQKEPLVTHIYTADPSAHVFNGKIYVYPSHDLEHDGEDNDEGDEYQMEDYHILSMDNVDAPCIDNGEAFSTLRMQYTETENIISISLHVTKI